MDWVCEHCTLRNKASAAECSACSQPRRAAPAAGVDQQAEVIDLLADSDEEPSPAKKPQLPASKPQLPSRKQQQAKGHRGKAGPGGGAMGSGGSKASEPAGAAGAAEDSPSFDDDFQVQLSDWTSSRRRGTQGTGVTSGSIQKPGAKQRQLRAVQEPGSGSSAETAVAAQVAGGGGTALARQHAPAQQAAVQQQERQQPAASVTSGSPAPWPLSDNAGSGRGAAQQHTGKRQRENSAAQPAIGTSKQPAPPAGLAGQRLPPSKKQRLAVAGAAVGAAALDRKQAAAGGGEKATPAELEREKAAAGAAGEAASPAKRETGLTPLPPQHKKKKKKKKKDVGEQQQQQVAAAAARPTCIGGSTAERERQAEAGLLADTAIAAAAAAAAARAAVSPAKPSPRQLLPAAKGLPVLLQRKKLLSKRPREQQPQLPAQAAHQEQQQQQRSAHPAEGQQQQRAVKAPSAPPPGAAVLRQQAQAQAQQQAQQQEQAQAQQESPQQQQQQPALPVQASLRLPPRRSPAALASTRGSPASMRASASPAQVQQQGSPESVRPQRLASDSPEGAAAQGRHAQQEQQQQQQQVVKTEQEEVQEGLEEGEEERQLGQAAGKQEALEEEQAAADEGHEGGLAASRQEQPLGPQDWWRGMALLYGRGLPSAPAPGQEARGTQAAAAAVVGSALSWVQKAKQAAVDITPTLLAGVARCPTPCPPHAAPENQAGMQLAGAPPGWLAYRVAAQLPQAAACRTAADLLQLGATAAAAAGRLPAWGAGLVPAQAPLGTAAADLRQQDEEQQEGAAAEAAAAAPVDMCEAATRLLVAPRHQAQPMDLAERTRRWFSQRTSTLRKELRQRLAEGPGGGAGGGGSVSSGGGRRSAAAAAGEAGKRAVRGPSRLRHEGGAGGAGSGPDRPPSRTVSVEELHRGGVAGGGACGGAPQAGATQYKGVRHSGNGVFTCSVFLLGRQTWLGTFPSLPAAARAVDMAWAWRWLQNHRKGAKPVFNLPHNRYLEDEKLVRTLMELPDGDALKQYVKQQCGAHASRWG